ncbi:hypothetical protein P691DRAFT_778801 [Macrolepiota fuliginosa MF-IS2]|uniref:DUF6533 domain-containing protein n=1 Tax=Macrolepiota fuliginosa MF-IS2 TaxID=1400762 RepID=A0A9P5X554_9AGAR|nr:hypothetical protein P691DRAFT_778801 [Macrolepiota fuliginosa MF-IS2]
MDPAEIPQIIQQLSTAIGEYRNVNSLTVAAMVVMIFDWLLTFEMEVSYIWQAPWNMMKVLYLFSRYLAFIDVTVAIIFGFVVTLPVESCSRIFQCAAVMYCIGMGVADIIFTLRTWVVWGRKRHFGIALAIFYVVAWLTFVIPVAFYLKSLFYVTSPLPQLLGCAPQSPSTLFSISFAGAMAFDLVMLILMAIRAMSLFRSGNSDLIKVILRDGIIYYVYTFIISALNFFVILKLSKDYADLLLTMERVLRSVLSCRVILHIRQQGEHVVGTRKGPELPK